MASIMPWPFLVFDVSLPCLACFPAPGWATIGLSPLAVSAKRRHPDQLCGHLVSFCCLRSAAANKASCFGGSVVLDISRTKARAAWMPLTRQSISATSRSYSLALRSSRSFSSVFIVIKRPAVLIPRKPATEGGEDYGAQRLALKSCTTFFPCFAVCLARSLIDSTSTTASRAVTGGCEAMSCRRSISIASSRARTAGSAMVTRPPGGWLPSFPRPGASLRSEGQCPWPAHRRCICCPQDGHGVLR